VRKDVSVFYQCRGAINNEAAGGSKIHILVRGFLFGPNSAS